MLILIKEIFWINLYLCNEDNEFNNKINDVGIPMDLKKLYKIYFSILRTWFFDGKKSMRKKLWIYGKISAESFDIFLDHYFQYFYSKYKILY